MWGCNRRRLEAHEMKEPLHTVGSLWYQWPLEAKNSNAMSKSIWIQGPSGELCPTRNTLLCSLHFPFNFCFQVLVVSQHSSQFCSLKLFLYIAHSTQTYLATLNNIVLGRNFWLLAQCTSTDLCKTIEQLMMWTRPCMKKCPSYSKSFYM